MQFSRSWNEEADWTLLVQTITGQKQTNNCCSSGTERSLKTKEIKASSQDGGKSEPGGSPKRQLSALALMVSSVIKVRLCRLLQSGGMGLEMIHF